MPISQTQIGSGLFRGRAVYDDSVFHGIQEDVSDDISMISPYETPLLSIIGDAQRPATNIWHEWVEEELNPNFFSVAADIASTTAETNIRVGEGAEKFLLPGMMLRTITGEYMMVTAVGGPTSVGVTRGFTATDVTSLGQNSEIAIVHRAAVDGQDVLADTSRPRKRVGNVVAPHMQEIIVSDTDNAVLQHGGIVSEFDHQTTNRMREALRDLNKSIILSRSHSGITALDRLPGGSSNAARGVNVRGSETQPRTMMGLLQMVKTNNITASIGNSRSVTDLGSFDDRITELCQRVYESGAEDCDLILVGDQIQRRFDLLNYNRTRTPQEEMLFGTRVTRYQNNYGEFTVMQHRWMPRNKLLLLCTNRLAIANLRGQSFHKEIVARTGAADKGMIVGHYTLEVRQEAGMGQMTFDDGSSTFSNAPFLAP